MIHRLWVSKSNKMLLSQISFPDSSPVISSYLETFGVFAPLCFLPLGQSLFYWCQFFSWSSDPTLEAIVISGLSMWVTRLLLRSSSCLLSSRDPQRGSISCLQFPGVPANLYLDARAQAQPPCLLYLNAELSAWWGSLHMLSEASIFIPCRTALVYAQCPVHVQILSDRIFGVLFLYASKSDEPGKNCLAIYLSMGMMRNNDGEIPELCFHSRSFLIWFSEATHDAFVFYTWNLQGVPTCFFSLYSFQSEASTWVLRAEYQTVSAK